MHVIAREKHVILIELMSRSILYMKWTNAGYSDNSSLTERKIKNLSTSAAVAQPYTSLNTRVIDGRKYVVQTTTIRSISMIVSTSICMIQKDCSLSACM